MLTSCIFRITGDLNTGQLLGAHLLDHKNSEVSKRVDIFATGLFRGMRVEDFGDLDLSYTPSLSSPWTRCRRPRRRGREDETRRVCRLSEARGADWDAALISSKSPPRRVGELSGA